MTEFSLDWGAIQNAATAAEEGAAKAAPFLFFGKSVKLNECVAVRPVAERRRRV